MFMSLGQLERGFSRPIALLAKSFDSWPAKQLRCSNPNGQVLLRLWNPVPWIRTQRAALGTIALLPVSDVASVWVDLVYVRPKLRRRGICRALLRYVLRVVTGHAATTIACCRLTPKTTQSSAHSSHCSPNFNRMKSRICQLPAHRRLNADNPKSLAYTSLVGGTSGPPARATSPAISRRQQFAMI